MRNDKFLENISVIYFPDSNSEKYLSPIIEEWTKEGLLGRFFFLTPEDVSISKTSLSKLNAKVWVRDQGEYILHEVDLLEQLAQVEFQIVRFIAVNALRDTAKLKPENSTLISQVADAITSALPMANARTNILQAVSRFLKINLVIAPSEKFSEKIPRLFDGNWDLQVIASPEDRATPWTADAQVRDDERFQRFILMHLATSAALWNGISSSPFDLVGRDSLARDSKWVSRVFVNTILTDGLARRVSARVLDDISNASKEIYDSQLAINVPGTVVIPPDLVESYLNWMVDTIFNIDNSALSFNEPSTAEEPGKLRILEWQQIKEFLHFSWDKIKYIPWWMYVFVRRLIGRKLENAFQGDEGLAQVGISQDDPMDLRDRRLVERLSQILKQSEEAKKVLSSVNTSTAVKVNPKLWTSIRKLVFGMLDGSDLSEFELPQEEGRVPVFASTSQIVTNPNDAVGIPASVQKILSLKSTQLTWTESGQVPQITESLNLKLTELNSLLDTSYSNLNERKLKIDSLNREGGGQK